MLLLSRLHDWNTGEVVKELNVDIPEYYKEEAKSISEFIGESFYTELKPILGLSPMSAENLAEMYLNRNWRANLTVIG